MHPASPNVLGQRQRGRAVGKPLEQQSKYRGNGAVSSVLRLKLDRKHSALNPRVAVDAAMRTSSIRVEAESKAYVGTVVFCDDGLRVVGQILRLD